VALFFKDAAGSSDDILIMSRASAGEVAPATQG